jgi:glycosyltransferase involved in cell wall biosynthesis
MDEFVSIVLPTYNGAKYIRSQVDSLLKQSYSNFELITQLS